MLFHFGKKRVRRASALLLKLCRKYNVRTVTSSGTRRSPLVLRNECVKCIKKMLAGQKVKRSRFGSNPPLSQTMGSSFCSDGGGVLGAFSTGLYISPCKKQPVYPKNKPVSLNRGGFPMKNRN